jgi:hypothetical protein
MNRQTLLAFLSSLGVAIGAGLASALLFLVLTKGTIIALCLAYFAPLPLMIASLGFGQWTGLVGALLGSGLVAALAYPSVGAALYPIAIAVPAWLICAAALRGAPPAEQQSRRTAAQQVQPTAPNGVPMRALTAGTLFLAAAFSMGALILAGTYGGLSAALARLTGELAPLIRELKNSLTSLPESVDPDRLAWLLARTIAPTMAASALSVVIANLWLAARTVQISARLPTIWPDIPYNLRLPVPLAAALIPAIGLIFVGREIGFVALIVAAVLGTALSLQGLAVMHDLTRGMSARTPLLFGAYLVMSFIPPWPMAVFSLVGLVDAALGLRERKRLRQAAPPPSP